MALPQALDSRGPAREQRSHDGLKSNRSTFDQSNFMVEFYTTYLCTIENICGLSRGIKENDSVDKTAHGREYSFQLFFISFKGTR